MSDPIGGKTANNLTAKTTPAETDYILMAENKITKRTKISDFLTFLKDKLGINTLNTNLTTNISVAHVVGTSFCVYNSQFVFVHIGVEVPSKLEAKDTQLEENRTQLEKKDSQLEEKDAEIARLKKLLEEQNK